ncbi:gamma carbonic anhydrase family protein [Thermodesulfobacteriota bacterium]
MIRKNGVYLMESAEIIGDVKIGKDSSVWSKVVIRCDDTSIKIGKNTNIQDLCVLHTKSNVPMEIGDNVTIGHSAIVHCKRIDSNCIIGMGSMLLDNVEIGEYSIIAAGAVIPANKIIPPRSLVMGIPGKIERETDNNYIKEIETAAQDYLRLAAYHYGGHKI